MTTQLVAKKNILIVQKAQSMTEMAVFGSLLLMVLAWLVQMGMAYTEQQKLNMEAYRTALALAGEDNPLNHTQLVYVKDVHIPNPQDKLGKGGRQTMGSGDYITWTNDSGNLGVPPVMTYWFNPDDLNVARSYALAGVFNNPNNGINVTVPVTSTTNSEIAFIPRDRTSIYNRTNELTGIEERQTRVLLPVSGLGTAGMGTYDPYCQTHYCPTDIVYTADADLDDRITQEYIGYDRDRGYGPVGAPGTSPTAFRGLDYQEGDIDGDRTTVNFEGPAAERVLPNQRQGLLSPEVTYSRDDKNILRDSNTSIVNRDDLDQSDLMNHRIRTNTVTDVVPQQFTIQGTETWTTSK